jgi:TRAP-type C4-dicarboxylate transport system permease small subunit
LSEPKVKRPALDTAEALGRWIENALLSALLAGMIGLGALQIILRWSSAGSLVWADEAIRMMVLWIAMVAGVAAAREDRHISIDVLSRFLAPRARAITAAAVDLFTAGVCLALAWYGGIMVQFAIEDGDVLLTGLPAWIFQAVIPVAFLLMGYRYFLLFIRRVRQIVSGSNA